MSKAALFDSLIRVVTIVIRGLFIFAAAKYLPANDFGMYVAIGAVVALLQYAVAGDFSYIAHREFFLNRISFDEMLKTQAVIMAILFTIAIPTAIVLLPSELKKYSIMMTLLILLAESLSSELQRHLVAIARFTSANVLLFLKSGSWMVLTLLTFASENSSADLEFILNAWIIGLMLSVIFGILSLRDHFSMKSKSSIKLIEIYIKKVAVVLIGTLAARSIFSVDRIIIEKFMGLGQVAAYGLFIGIASGFVAIVDSGILTRAYPKLVTYASSDLKSFHALSRLTQLRIMCITIAAVLAYYLFIGKFLQYVFKGNYSESIYIGFILIVAYGVYSLSFSLNCWLYALNKDKLITMINVISLMPFAIYSASGAISMFGVAMTLLSCAAMHYILRLIYFAVKREP